MKSKSKLMTLAIIYCVVVCGIANILYYGAKYGFNLIMFSLAIKNIISSFTLTTGLSLSELLSYGRDLLSTSNYPDFIKTEWFFTFLINAYAISSAIAPLCTASALVLSARVFFRRLFAKKNVGSDKIVVFGYNEKVKNAIRKQENITIIAKKPIDSKEEYLLRRKNIHFHYFDVANEDEKATVQYLKKLEMENVQKILIMDDSDATNFSIYQRLVSSKIGFKKDCIVKAECDSALIQQLFINSYQNYKSLPIVLFTSKSLTANTILNQYPVFKEIKTDCPRILILGFGQTGQQICQRITNEGIMSAHSYVYIDVVDRTIDDDRTEFLSKLSGTIGQIDENCYLLTNPQTDGRLEIHFHEYNITSINFTDFLKKQKGYDYCAVITGNSDSALEAIIRIDGIIKEKNWTAFPIVACNDRVDEVIRYVNEDQSLYKNIHFVQKSGSIDMIFNETNEQQVIKFYNHYDDINVLSSLEIELDEDEWLKVNDWSSMDFYAQGVIRKMYNHQAVKIEILKEKYGSNYIELLKQRFGENGTILKKHEGKFVYEKDLSEVIELLQQDELAREMAMLEHRRWCIAMTLDGYSVAENFDEVKKTSPWLIQWQNLKEKYPEVCLYRLKPLLYMLMEQGKQFNCKDNYYFI